MVVPIVFRFGRLGDMVMLTSLLQLLRQRYGSPCELYAAGPWNAALFSGNPDVLKLWTLGRHTPVGLGVSWWQAWWRLRRSRGRPIYVCEEQPRKLRRILRLFWMAGVRREQCVFITQMPSDIDSHWLDRLARFGALTPAAFSRVPVDAEPADRAPRPRLLLFPAELTVAHTWLAQQGWRGREIILVQPGNFRTMSAHRGKWRQVDDKAWPLENWVALLRRLAEARPEAVLLVCGAPQEAAMIAQTVSATRLAQVCSAALPLRRFLALCRLAHSMISIDTGPAHVAAALGVPLTVMYGAESPQKWLPCSAEGSAVLAVGGPPRSRVALLSVDEVFQCWLATQDSEESSEMGTFLVS
jgi:heptosyltransferase-2/heptosyltransferase-3